MKCCWPYLQQRHIINSLSTCCPSLFPRILSLQWLSRRSALVCTDAWSYSPLDSESGISLCWTSSCFCLIISSACWRIASKRSSVSATPLSFVSSVNLLRACSAPSSRSLTNILNGTGLSVELWGIPLVSNWTFLLITLFWAQSFCKFFIHLSVHLSIHC